MINESILFLTVSDQRGHRLTKYAELGIEYPDNFDRVLHGSLGQLFKRVIPYDFRRRYTEAGVKVVNQEIIDLIKKEQPKYLLWISSMYEIEEATFQEIRKEGAIIVGWFFDDEFRFDDYSKWWIPHLDYVLTVDRESVKRYEELGARSLNLLVCSNPDYFKRLNLSKKYDVSFVGTSIADRSSLIDGLKGKGIDVYTFGKGWDTGYISFDEMVNIYNSSKINLSFMKSYGTRPQMKCKIFDICMCGGSLLCEYIPGIEEFYEVDKEIVCFKDIEEAAEKIKYYLSHEAERERIAQAGYERAHRDHDMAKRMSEVFEEIEKDTKTGAHSKPSPEVLEMPRSIRRQASTFHLNWARALLLEGYKGLWRDELDLVLHYDPRNLKARLLRLTGFLPSCIPLSLVRLNDGLGRWKSKAHPYRDAIRRSLWPFDDYYPYPSLKTTIVRYMKFLKDLRMYHKMPGAKKFDFRWVNPFINDKYSSAGDTGQYFYQDIWAFRRIQKTRPNWHVDVGSRMIFVGMLTTITRVTFIDVRTIQCDLTNFETKIGDITNLPYPDNSIPSLSCLHVAEHIGLGRYGDKLDPKGTEKAVAELIRVLAPDGNLFFSVPVAKEERVYFNSHRLYSISTILKMFSSLDIVELSGIDGRNHFIENIDPKVFDEVEHLWGGVCLLWLRKSANKSAREEFR